MIEQSMETYLHRAIRILYFLTRARTEKCLPMRSSYLSIPTKFSASILAAVFTVLNLGGVVWDCIYL